ncbi:pyrophosphate--fructose-6-phosphate 1-phosphotransferase [Kineosporia sp. J2-2]|uniref:Pyrophosphate--fructose 6-phosphate 1-phosphotransferase n=1 Tax=Kineosporia corallincola TaxID=2835133 RepID=A0ABS5TDS6_9ACTN|nr:pyrophosphate--fructose-6-phosphate 1-phosphotransferase [Kineosporia corallincola]MBT0769234.1 pyrophosphate--fructose-6-phosphate 1-phosphotransferase [Kineosporia corallincola]
MSVRRVALLTAGGLAPCLSSSVGGLIERYTEIAPEVEIIGYRNGYAGLLAGDHLDVTPEIREKAPLLHNFGGSPIGNSRVKLTNVADCVRRGLVKEGQDPLKVAAEQLTKDGVQVLHTIGGDDTNTTAADLAAYLHENGYELTVVGLPKTIDNDVVPIRQSLGAWTAAEQGAVFARNVIAEHSSNLRMLIVHEVMGRNCGWLTAATAAKYREWVTTQQYAGFGNEQNTWDVHAVFVPELDIDIEAEATRLRAQMDATGAVNIFLSEGAGVDSIVAEMTARGEEPAKDAFGHVKLDTINPGQWFAQQFAEKLGAEKVLVQKSGYFSRAAAANSEDLRLIKGMVDLAVESALARVSGVIGHDEEQDNRLRAIEFPRIRGGKPFDTGQAWFGELLGAIGQEKGKPVSTSH